MDTQITEAVIRRAAEGDTQAFERIYNEYFGFVANVAYRIVTQREEAEEICQEVFMIIYRKLKNFRGEAALKTWIYRITINYAVKYAKRNQKYTRQVRSYDEANAPLASGESTRVKAEQKEEKDLVHRLLNHLNTDQRTCIVLRSLEGLSYQEIARVLRIPVNTVRTRIKRAREHLVALRKEVMAHEM